MTRWGILATGGIAGTFAADLRQAPGAELLAVGSRSAGGGAGLRRPVRRPAGVRVLGGARRRPRRRRHLRRHPARRPPRRGADLPRGPARRCSARSRSRSTAPRPRRWSTPPASAGVFLMEAMWTRCNPAVRRILALIADGAIGELDHGAGRLRPRRRRSRPTHRLRAPRARRRRAARPRRLPGHVRPPVPRRARPHPGLGADRPGGHRREHRHDLRVRLRRGRHPHLRHRRRHPGRRHDHRHRRAGSSCRRSSTRPASPLHRDGGASRGRRPGAGGRGLSVRGDRGAALPRRGAAGEPARAARHDPRGDGPARRGPRADRRDLPAAPGVAAG